MQDNCTDCGLFVCTNAEYFTYKLPPCEQLACGPNPLPCAVSMLLHAGPIAGCVLSQRHPAPALLLAALRISDLELLSSVDLCEGSQDSYYPGGWLCRDGPSEHPYRVLPAVSESTAGTQQELFVATLQLRLLLGANFVLPQRTCLPTTLVTLRTSTKCYRPADRALVPQRQPCQAAHLDRAEDCGAGCGACLPCPLCHYPAKLQRVRLRLP